MDVLLQFAGSPGQGVIGVAFVCLWALGVIVHIAFALAVLASAHRKETTFVGPGMWALATLLGGPMVALAYWVINVSSLSAGAKR